jgi:hypothetical protein
MKLKVTKALAFEIDPDKNYVCLIQGDTYYWSQEQQDSLAATLKARNIEVAYLPPGSKFKLVEQPNGKTK